jgi:peptide subunit release factor 1 (eRF1)
MSMLDGTLSELARLRSGSEPIVSLYLDVRWSDERQRDRVRLYVQDRIRKTLGHYPDDAPGHEALSRTLGRVQEFVNGLTTQANEAEKNGLALFACESLSLWRTHFFHRTFQPELCTDGIPHLTQLARLADDDEPAIVIMPSRQGADVFQVLLGDLARQEQLRGPLPRSDGDGWNTGTGEPGGPAEREKRDQRGEEERVHRTWRLAAEQATQLLDGTLGAHLVLIGPSATLAAFERELPDRLRARVIARVPRPRQWASNAGVQRDGIIAGAADAVTHHEAQAEAKAVAEVVGQSLRGGLAVLGPEDVVQALNQGRVHRLVLEEDFARTGWRCDNCDALGANAESAEVCPYCAGALRAVQYLGEALVARTLGEGGAVELVRHTHKLHSYRGVGAFLRQSAGNGLKGAKPDFRSP